MKHFLSCDWGTSSFRLRLVDANSLHILAEIKSSEGISDTYRSWTRQPGADRQLFYTDIINTQVDQLSRDPGLLKQGIGLEGVPIVLSGMASSTIGLMDMPYKALPFRLDGSDLNVCIERQHSPRNPVIIISGARSTDDVMRGEETKVVGCAPELISLQDRVQLLLPGTHPKHVYVDGQQAFGLKSYMTGEFFDVFTENGVLSASVQQGGDFNDPLNQEHFDEGVRAALKANLLHAAFMVRTRQVLQQVPLQQNYYYLSGLLIGYELKEIDSRMPLYLVCGALHKGLYTRACAVLQIPVTKIIDADEALIRGQQIVLTSTALV